MHYFMEVSPKTNYNVNEFFEAVIKQYILEMDVSVASVPWIGDLRSLGIHDIWLYSTHNSNMYD